MNAIHGTKTAGNSGQKITVTPLSAAAAKASNQPGLDSEFCRPGDCQRLFGLKRGVVYVLEKERLIKTVSLRRPGMIKGCKLIHVASVREFLDGQMEKTAAAVTPKTAIQGAGA